MFLSLRAGMSLGLASLLVLGCASLDSPPAETRPKAPEVKPVPKPTMEQKDGYARIVVHRPIATVFEVLSRQFLPTLCGPNELDHPTDWHVIGTSLTEPEDGKARIEIRESAKPFFYLQSTMLVLKDAGDSTHVDVTCRKGLNNDGDVALAGWIKWGADAHQGINAKTVHYFFVNTARWD